MNLILLDSMCHKQKLPAEDRRSVHIRGIVGRKDDERLFVGFQNGPIGRANVEIEATGEVNLTVEWWRNEESEKSRRKLWLLIPYCRPQTCKKILREAASLGIGRLVFFKSDRGEAGYAESSLWKTDEWQQLILAGVEQAFVTEVPAVTVSQGNLEAAILQVADDAAEPLHRIALDNYEASNVLGSEEMDPNDSGCVLAIGSERGWSAEERICLIRHGFTLHHMGHRVMRTETAVVAACSVVNASMGVWKGDTADFLDGMSL